jgi:hypothetical protein
MSMRSRAHDTNDRAMYNAQVEQTHHQGETVDHLWKPVFEHSSGEFPTLRRQSI